MISCTNSIYKIKNYDYRLWLSKNNLILDSIALFKEGHLRYRLTKNTLYYTDGITIPGRLNLYMYKIKIETDTFSIPQKKELINLSMDHWIVKKLHITNENVFIKTKEIEKNITKIEKISLDSLFKE